MRNSPYGSVQSAVSAAYKAFGGVQAVSDSLGLTISTVSEANDPEKRPHGLQINYLHILGQIKPESAEPIAKHFAALAGGAFQPIASNDKVTCLIQQTGVVAKECGEAQAATLRAAQQASTNHCDDAAREIDEAVAALLRAKAEIIAKRSAA